MNNGWEALGMLLTAAIILLHSFIAALVAFGWCAAFESGEIFGKIGDWLDERLPEYLQKPLYACPKCNSFWWATLFYWVLWGNTWYLWLMTGVAAIGIAAVIIKIYSPLGRMADKLDEDYE